MEAFEIHIPDLAPVVGELKQIAYIVDDIDDAIADWHDKYGIGPWVVARDASPIVNARYRGAKSERIVLDLAFGYTGDLQIELIRLKQDVPSMYKEAIDRGQRDLQHYGVCAADFDAASEHATANGFAPVLQCGMPGLARMEYVEAVDFDQNVFGDDESSYMVSPEGHGIVLEIIEYNALTRPYFDRIHELVHAIPDGELTRDFDINDLASKPVVMAAVAKMTARRAALKGRAAVTRGVGWLRRSLTRWTS
ncbi:MAG: VOC family protein [Acidimicrobiales bacterium]